MSFKDQYLEFKQPSQARENFVYNSVVSTISKEQIINNMKLITIKQSDGSSVTFKVMPDFLSIDNFRIPLAPFTAQKLAQHYGLSLPSASMARDIYKGSNVKIDAKPLSGTGTTLNGQHLTGADVVRKGVGYADFADKYNDRINQQIQNSNYKPGDIVDGFAKTVVSNPGDNHVGLQGFWVNNKAIQNSLNGETPHDQPESHVEYGSFGRFVSPTLTITYPDGHTEVKPTAEVYNIKKYKIPNSITQNDKPTTTSKPEQTLTQPTTPTEPSEDKTNEDKPSPRMSFLQKIDNFLSGLVN